MLPHLQHRCCLLPRCKTEQNVYYPTICCLTSAVTDNRRQQGYPDREAQEEPGAEAASYCEKGGYGWRLKYKGSVDRAWLLWLCVEYTGVQYGNVTACGHRVWARSTLNGLLSLYAPTGAPSSNPCTCVMRSCVINRPEPVVEINPALSALLTEQEKKDWCESCPAGGITFNELSGYCAAVVNCTF